MTPYSRIFGSGPIGLLLSVLLLIGAYLAAHLVPMPPLIGDQNARWGMLFVGLIGTIGLVAWSLRSLPPSARGRALCTHGALRYVRHPLYASFLSFFNFCLALFLGHPVYLLWALALHPLWHGLMRHEEALMACEFGEAYRHYAQRTGRFVPRFWRR